MDKVVVVDSDSEHALMLKARLEGAGCFVEVCASIRFAADVAITQETEIVVLVHQSPTWWKTDTRKLCKAMSWLDQPPVVLGLLRWPSQGPYDRLYGDGLKVMVFHER